MVVNPGRTRCALSLGNVNFCNLPVHNEAQLHSKCLKISPLTVSLSPRFQVFGKICKHCMLGNHSFLSGVPVEGLFGSAYLHDVLSELNRSICVRSEWSQVSVLHWICVTAVGCSPSLHKPSHCYHPSCSTMQSHAVAGIFKTAQSPLLWSEQELTAVHVRLPGCSQQWSCMGDSCGQGVHEKRTMKANTRHEGSLWRAGVLLLRLPSDLINKGFCLEWHI